MLQVEIKLEKQNFKIGEPIILTYLLKNMSSEETVLLSSMPFVYLPSLLRIKAPNGELMKSEKARGQFSNSEQMLFPLLPGGTYSFSFDLRKQYPFGFLENPHHFNVPGTYEISGVYQNQKATASRTDLAWDGQVFSKPITIVIEELTPQEVGSLKQKLQSGSEKEKINVLSTISRSKVVSLLEEVSRTIRNKDSSLDVRRVAAITLHDLATPKLLDTYISQLDSPDSTIRSEMALAIRKLWLSKQTTGIKERAVPVLLTVSDPRQFPKSYVAALSALGAIGDQRAIPVIKKIIETGPEEEDRAWAREVLRKIEAKPQGTITPVAPEIGPVLAE